MLYCLLALLLSVACALSVAWCMAFWSIARPTRHLPEEGVSSPTAPAWQISRTHDIGIERLTLQPLCNQSSVDIFTTPSTGPFRASWAPLAHMPSSVAPIIAQSPEHVSTDYHALVVNAGLPFKCFSSTLEYQVDYTPSPAYTTTRVRHGVLIGSVVTISQEPRFPILPFRPLFWPLLANVAVYLAAVGAMLLTIRFVQRARRSLSGLCVNCKYPLGNLVICPECGTSRAVATAPNEP